MTTSIVIDVASGTDDGASALEAAAIASLELDGDLQFVCVGDDAEVTRRLRGLAHDAERLRVVHAPHIADRSLPLAEAIARAPESTVDVGLAHVADEPGAAFVTAGHPGVIVDRARHRLGALPGVPRPALAAVVPTLRHRGHARDPFALLLDVGAQSDATSDDLVAWARMGALYVRAIAKVDRPRVALLSNASTLAGAPDRVRAAHARLDALGDAVEHLDPIRADRIFAGDADVIVSDGFTGDVVVRSLEGLAKTAESVLEMAKARFRWRMGVSMLANGLEQLRGLANWENYGGAPLLGLDRTVIVTQRNSGQRAFVNAIRLAAKVERHNLADVTRALTPG